jgi:putative glutamine amidotransferase
MSRPCDSTPLVAVSGSNQRASWGAWNEVATLVPFDYPRAVEEAGGVPVVVSAGADPRVIAARVDGLVLTGGGDLDPRLYEADPHPQTHPPDSPRDEFESRLLEASCERGVPVLAICRGMQVLNVARGGSLHQHLPDAVGNESHLPTPGSYGRHPVRVGPGSRLASIVGDGIFDVPTHHHQAVERLGRGLVATAWAEDGTVEALEDPSFGFLVAVQWHPEAGEDRSLFRALVAASEA